jgi:hypothetical protein
MDSDGFSKSVGALGSSTADGIDIVSAFTQFMPHVVGDFEGADVIWPISLRTTWLFPNGYLLVIAPSFGPTISKLDDELVSWDSMAPVPEEHQPEWKVESFANGWILGKSSRVFPTADQIMEVIEMMTEVNGQPRLLIPWRETWAQEGVDQGDAFFLEDWTNPQGDFDPFRKSIQLMYKAVISGELEKQSPWKVDFVGAHEFMPSLCGYSDLQRFLTELEARELASVVRDVWLDQTSASDAEVVRAANPEYAHLPLVWVIKDHAMYTYFGNGWINNLTLKVSDGELEREMYLLADELELGLITKYESEEVEDEEWEAEGFFQIGSQQD